MPVEAAFLVWGHPWGYRPFPFRAGSQPARLALDLTANPRIGSERRYPLRKADMASNAELHGKLDQALDQGEIDTAKDLIAEEVLVHFSSESPFPGEHRGREAFFELFGSLSDLTDGTLSIEHRETLDNEDYSIAISKASARRGDKELDSEMLDICRWQDDQVVEEWIVPFDQGEADAFWAWALEGKG
jgi:uncharacterized protein